MMSRLRWRTFAAIGALVLPAFVCPAPAHAFPPTNRAAMISFLNNISGRYMLSGQHNREPNSDPTRYTRTAQAITGQTPGLWGGDFLFLADDVNHRQTMTNEAIRQWQGGSVVALTWHMCPPTVGQTCGWDSGGILSHLSDAQWNELMTNGSNLNNRWKQRLNEIVPYLRQLQNAGVPALFRPIHEMNEGWSWWGGRPGPDGSRRLYQITRDYLVNAQGLTNLVWVWNLKDVSGGEGGAGNYWPGASYVDVASLDVWVNQQPTWSWYQAILTVAGGKPIALGEVGSTPTPSTMNAQPRWTWWMVWAEWLTDPAWNTQSGVQQSYFAPRVLNRGEFSIGGGGARTGPITGLAGKCVDVRAANPANGTQVQLYTCNGTNAQQWTVGTDGTIRALGKCLDVNGGINANGTKVQIWDCVSGNTHQQWVYHPSTRDLVNPQTGRCLDVAGQNSADSTPLQIWSCNGQTNQDWNLP